MAHPRPEPKDLIYRPPKPEKPKEEVMVKKGGAIKGPKKVEKVMREFKSGKLHSGKSGKIVKNPKQAVAIAMSEAGMSKKRGKK